VSADLRGGDRRSGGRAGDRREIGGATGRLPPQGPGLEADRLAGKRVVVTRAVEQAEGLCVALEARGARAIRCPTIRLAPPDDWVPIDAALGRIDSYDWVVFTSPNGVRFTLERIVALGLDATVLRRTRVASVGRRTARALVERGVDAAFVAPDEGSIPLAESLAPVEGAVILMARRRRSPKGAWREERR
jgi:uroporphyrinogen III methyltransferase/synthase